MLHPPNKANYFPIPVRAFLLCVALTAASLGTTAQQPVAGVGDEREHGIGLYKQGDAIGAVVSLKVAVKRNKDDITAWHYLGLALSQLGKNSYARKAHEKAAKIADTLLTSLLDRLSTLPKTQLLEAADSADQYLTLSGNPSKKKKQEWQLTPCLPK